jgi:hypothetical protein
VLAGTVTVTAAAVTVTVAASGQVPAESEPLESLEPLDVPLEAPVVLSPEVTPVGRAVEAAVDSRATVTMTVPVEVEVRVVVESSTPAPLPPAAAVLLVLPARVSVCNLVSLEFRFGISGFNIRQ